MELYLTLKFVTFLLFQVLEFAGLISSCYCVIENVIEYLTQGPSMLLSEDQRMSL